MAADIPTSESFEPDEAGVSQRQRRAERHRAQERKDLPKRALKTGVIAAIVILAIAGAVWAVPKLADLGTDKCVMKDSHEHASFYVFDNMTRIGFQHQRFDLRSGANPQGYLPMKAHLHQPNDWQLHLEYGCSTMGDFFGYIGGDLKPGRFRLDNDQHGGRVLEDTENQTLQFYLFQPDNPRSGSAGNWTAFPDLHNHQMRQYEKALIVFGNYTPEQLVQLQNQVPTAQDGGSQRNVPANGFLAVLASAGVVLWAFARRLR